MIVLDGWLHTDLNVPRTWHADVVLRVTGLIQLPLLQTLKHEAREANEPTSVG